jgi:Zn finger protein HypA/HybF involved in hydrogenase expression
MALQANCPACGAQVIFKTGSSVVVVCEFCHSVVARTDRGVEDAGKVADIVESGSPLEVGLRGVYLGVAFELTGRAQLQHAAGGFWDEWYAAFTDGRWGWLAEAQGRFYLTFQIQAPRPELLPPYEQLQLGQPVYAIPSQQPPVVAEKGTARALGAAGEIPYRLKPGETYAYADMSGQSGMFGTLDYGESPPSVYVGREVSLEEIGLAQARRTSEREARSVTAAQLNCPNCGGPLELRAPDQSERVTCPNCGSLLDVNQGRLSYLKTLERKGSPPSIPLGSTAEFDGQPQTVIGFIVRSVEFDGVRYFWQEYLLYNPAVGFRWLVESDGHWSYVKSVPPGEVLESGNGANYGGKRFKIFQDAVARVEYVEGEFYWKVSVGEMARATDYVNAPLMLSKEVPVEQSARGAALHSEEVNWSLGAYTPLKEIERKFNVNLPSPHTVAPNQPWTNGKIYAYWAAFMVVALFAGVLMFIAAPRSRVLAQAYTLTPSASPTPAPGDDANEKTQVIFTDPIELHGRENIRITGGANVDNNWLYVAGDLVNEETGLVQSFDLPIEYYYGVEDGESWSEGDREQTVYLPAMPEGRYTMRLEAQWENWNQVAPPQLTVKVEQGVPRFMNIILLLVALSILPLLSALRHFSFERRRWADSSFNPYASSGGDGSGDDD